MNGKEQRFEEIKKEITDLAVVRFETLIGTQTQLFFDFKKQIERLSSDFSEHKEIQNSQHRETLEKIKNLEDKTDPIIEWFKNINFFKSGIMWLLALAGAIVGLLIALKQLWR